MKRHRRFRIVELDRQVWHQRDKSGRLRLVASQLPSSLPGSNNSAVIEGWHQSWNVAVQRFQALESSGDSVTSASRPDVLILSASSLLVLLVLSSERFDEQLLNENGESEWSSNFARKNDLEILRTRASEPVFANFNQQDAAWIQISGARLDLPCRLGFLERRARQNPDGFFGRLLARQNELRDYFRRG